MVLESESPKRKIHDLRVVDLRNELEKRGLDKSGVKAILIGRLSKALQDEGLNPDDYQFDISAGSATEKRTPKRGSSSRQDADTVSNPDSTLDVVDVSFSHELEEEPKEDVKEETKNEKEEEAENEKAEEKKAETKGDMEMENKEEAEIEEKEEEKEEAEIEKKEVRKPAEHVAQENDGVEDSINLTIEDEENFEEEEQNMKYKEATLDEQTLTVTRGGKQESSSALAVVSKDESKDSTKDFRGSETASSGPSDERDGKAQDSGPSQGERTKSATSSTANKEAKNVAKDDRADKKKNGTGGNGSGRNLWVSGLASSTRATDLKYLFSKYGKVIGAKVVTNARTPGARCYGYVTMNSSEEAAKCIQHLHRTELHGRMISVERAKGGEDPSSRGDVQKSDAKPSSENVEPKTDDKPEKTKAESPVKTDASSAVATPAAASASSTAAAAKGETGETKEEKETRDEKSGKANDKEKEEANKEKEKEREKEKPRVNRDQRIRPRRPPPKTGGGPGGPRGNVLTFRHIREERERQRQRDRERELRETERRRREEAANLREQERRQREEFLRLERERERLRLEREKLDREKAELLRLERETQRLERERIEREREELRRQQARSMARIEEARRATVKRPGAPMDERELLEDRKRVALDPARRYDRYDAPPSKPSSLYPVAPKAVERDYDRGRPDRYERGGGAPPPPPHHASSSSSHRRVMNEPPPPASHGRDASRGGPSSAGGGSQRERDDRRVVDRARDDRSDRDRGGRPSISGRDVYAERDRPRERVPEREPIRNRLDRDHRGERYPDPHSKSSDLRYSERGGGSGSSSLLGNGLAASHSSRDHGWGAASGDRKPEPLITGGGSWSSSAQPTDRWAQPHGSLSRSVGWPSSGAGLLPQMSGSMHNHSADAGGYGSDRYSRR